MLFLKLYQLSQDADTIRTPVYIVAKKNDSIVWAENLPQMRQSWLQHYELTVYVADSIDHKMS